MSHYKPYPAYKDSGVEWLGKVPVHWNVLPLKYLVKAVSGGQAIKNTVSSEPIYGHYPAFSASGQDVWMTEFEFDTSGIVLSAVGARCGKTFKADGKWGVVANTHCLFPKNEADRDYFWYLTNREDWWEKGGAAQPFVKVGETLDRKHCFPPKEEQVQIARALDRETARIDTLITKKTRFIELLREKRQAFITHAVTKGLNPNVKMKDSGVGWLGEVPEHWGALPLRRVVTAVKTGGTPSSEPPSPETEGFNWYTPGDFGGSLVLEASEKHVSITAVERGEAKVFPAGSVLVVSIGATLGKVGFLSKPGSANQQINAVIPNSCVDGYFLAYTLSVKAEAMWFLANAATIGIMNQEKTKEIWVSIPTLSEQKAITAYLDEETSRVDTLLSKTERSIELLKERRSALITAAVTGHIDLQPVDLGKTAK